MPGITQSFDPKKRSKFTQNLTKFIYEPKICFYISLVTIIFVSIEEMIMKNKLNNKNKQNKIENLIQFNILYLHQWEMTNKIHYQR